MVILYFVGDGSAEMEERFIRERIMVGSMNDGALSFLGHRGLEGFAAG